METKRSKYDTNPLDENEVRKTEEVWGQPAGSGQTTRDVKGATREIGSSANESARSNIYSEAPTRTFRHSAGRFALSFSFCSSDLFPACAISAGSP